MSTRTSIELHTGGCRLVEVEIAQKGRRGAMGDVRVRTFIGQIVDDDAAAFAARLAQMRQQRKLSRDACVTIWGLRSVQQLLRLPPAKPDDLEALATREAKKDVASLESDGEGATVGIIAGAEVQVGPHRRREVSLIAASTGEVRRRIQPIIDAGFVVDGVLTPALALTALARSQRDLRPGSAVAYVVLNAHATCLAIVRDGLLLFAREMPWGYETDSEAGSEDAVAARLTSELRRSILYFKQTFRSPVESVVICGEIPNLRALTAPLGTSLSVPVQTLDSLSGIDATTLPEPADQFRADAASLRLAIEVGAESSPPANLLPKSIRLKREGRTRVVRVGTSIAASLVLLAGWYALNAQAATRHHREVQEMRQQLSQLEPEAQRLDALRDAHGVATARNAALSAFQSQGPRLARLLEALASSTPEDIVITSVTVQSDTTRWRATVNGIAVTEDAASGQASVNALLRELSTSPYFGAPVQPPSLRVVSGTAATNGVSTPAGGPPSLPDGMSGVEFVASFVLAK